MSDDSIIRPATEVLPRPTLPDPAPIRRKLNVKATIYGALSLVLFVVPFVSVVPGIISMLYARRAIQVSTRGAAVVQTLIFAIGLTGTMFGGLWFVLLMLNPAALWEIFSPLFN